MKSKKYEYVFNLLDEKSVERKSWEERFEDLVSFVEIKGRMPFSSQCSEEEIVLYRWVNVQKNKIKKRQLEKKYENLIKNGHTSGVDTLMGILLYIITALKTV